MCYTAAMLPLAPFHPRFVHFPIALLLAGSAAALLYLVYRRQPSVAVFAWISLLLGWIALFPAVLTGLIDQNQAPQEPAVIAVLNPHIAIGFALLAIYGWLLYERLRNPQALDTPRLLPRLVALLILGIGLILVEGWLGGRLVFQFGVGVVP